MPFSIKRFAMHCSTSMPSGSRSDESKKNVQPNDQRRPASSSARKIIKKSASQEEHKGKQTSSQGLQSSHSVDSAELKRLRKQQNLIHRDEENNGADKNGIVSVRPSGEESRRIPRDALRRAQRDFQDKSSCDQSSALPGRWRAPGRIRSGAEWRGMYYDEQPEDNDEERKLFMRRDGTTRYFGQPSNVREGEWTEPKNEHSNKRSHSRQFLAASGNTFSVDLPNSSVELENQINRQGSQSPYQIPPSVHEDDPGIMSEVETSATGFRRSSKGRSPIPTSRPPLKSQERAISYPETQVDLEYGVVFLQYRNETKRSVLPDELTTLDTIKALFVRSFPKQLTMDYLDSPHIRIYIHDSSKDMFYELEDLRDIRDRSVLRINEQSVNGEEGFNSSCDQELSYFSEPELGSEYDHQHVHRAKQCLRLPISSGAYGRGSPFPSTPILPAEVNQCPPLRSYSPLPSEWRKRSHPIPVIEPRYEPQGGYPALHGYPYYPHGHSHYVPVCERGYESAYDSSPDREIPPSYPTPSGRRIEHQKSFGEYNPPWYDDPGYYRSQVYKSRSRSVTPLIDEEARKRMEFMEHQLVNLTGLVQKALTTPPSRQQSVTDETIPTRDNDVFKDSEDEYSEFERKWSRHSFKEEKSVSFSEDTTEFTDRQSSPEHTAEKPTKSAIKARSHYKDKDERPSGGKPKPPPKPTSLLITPAELRRYEIPKGTGLSPELCSKLRYLKRQTRDLQAEVRSLRRMAQSQAESARESVREICFKLKEMLAVVQDTSVMTEKDRIVRDENFYRQDVVQVEKDLSDLESQVEVLRGNVINRKCRVNMSCVEDMALLLSRASNTVADLKVRFPRLQDRMKQTMRADMEVVLKGERFLSDEPERLENAFRRCKKLTGTLVTLKRLASVQEQRHTGASSMPEKSLSADGPHSSGDTHTKTIDPDSDPVIRGFLEDHQRAQEKETALDELLNELQCFNQTEEMRQDTSLWAHGHFTSQHSEPSSHGPSRQQHAKGHLKTGSSSMDEGSKLAVNEGGTRRLSPSALDRNKNSVAALSSGRKNQNFQKPPYLAPKKVPHPPPRTTSRSVMQSSNISTLTEGDNFIHAASPSQLKTQLVNRRSQQCLQLLRSASDSSQKPASGDGPHSKPASNQMIRTRALDEFIRREQSSSSSSESVNSQEGLLLRNGPSIRTQLERSLSEGAGHGVVNTANFINRLIPSPNLLLSQSRQEILEYRQQELLDKQKRLQDQYTKLQQLQRAQFLTRSSPTSRALGFSGPGDLKKTGSENNILSKMKLSFVPTSSSLTQLSTRTDKKTSTETQIPGILGRKHKASTFPQSSNQIHETDII
ncbi:uncharacterized protein LOC143233580 isoform X3 [Tachypleus tridentatus]|uniref:uncharacterized protein LOC143233580 isoform X3 n=1 Tax=Tachypleus tridentatus TaxID=6853 RepID=UPI003FD2CD7E